MNHFTPDKLLRLLDVGVDEAFAAARAEWEQAVVAYDRQLRLLAPRLPPELRRLSRMTLLYADVLLIADFGDRLLVQLRIDFNPNEVIQLKYRLEGRLQVMPDALPALCRSGRPRWMHHEIERSRRPIDRRSMYTTSCSAMGGKS
jgi:hypothetical protein